MIRKIVVASVLGFLVSASGAAAQERPWQEIGIQEQVSLQRIRAGMGSTSTQQIRAVSPKLSLSFQSVAKPPTPATGTPGTHSRISPPLVPSVSKRMSPGHRCSGGYSATPHFQAQSLRPRGCGCPYLRPHGQCGRTCFWSAKQSRAAFVYGGGADYELSKHFTLRAEYRGFVYERPDFDLAALHSGATAHTAQPSAGIVFRF